MNATPLTAASAPDYFNAAAQHYASAYAAQTVGGHALRVRQRKALELLDARGGRVLDVGCGPGFFIEELLKRDAEVWGIDAAPSMIHECCRRLGTHTRAHFAVADAASLDFPAGHFDSAVCLGVIGYIPSQEAELREIVRVIRRGGTLLISFPNILSPYALWKKAVFYPLLAALRPLVYHLVKKDRPGTQLSYQFVVKMHTPRGAQAALERYGLTITGVSYYSYDPFLAPLDEIFPRLALRTTRWLEDRLSRSSLRWLGEGFIVKATKL